MNAETAFAEAKRTLALSGHKIFNVSRFRFRTTPALLAIRPPGYKQLLSGYVVRIFHNRLDIGWLQPDAADAKVRKDLKAKYGNLIRLRPRLFSYIRSENWQRLEELVSKEEREEFRQLLTDVRLP